MATKLGNNDTTFKVGSTDVDAIYLGSTLVYSSAPPSGDNVVTYTALEELSIYDEFRDENGNALAVISHTFSNGNGTIVLDGDVYGISHEAFEYNDYITSIVLPNTVTEIGDAAFDNCTSLTSINIPSGVTSIASNTFDGCESLQTVILPDGLTSIGYGAFQGCRSLSGTLTIPSGVTSIANHTFDHCESLEIVILPAGLTSIGESAFRECGLLGIYIPSGVTLIDEEAFMECGSMQAIQFGSTTPPTLGSMAFDNTGDCPIFVPSGYANTYKNAGGYWSDYEDRIQEL